MGFGIYLEYEHEGMYYLETTVKNPQKQRIIKKLIPPKCINCAGSAIRTLDIVQMLARLIVCDQQ